MVPSSGPSTTAALIPLAIGKRPVPASKAPQTVPKPSASKKGAAKPNGPLSATAAKKGAETAESASKATDESGGGELGAVAMYAPLLLVAWVWLLAPIHRAAVIHNMLAQYRAKKKPSAPKKPRAKPTTDGSVCS